MKTNLPKLGQPGAGLPWKQRLVLRLWYGPFVSKRSSRKENRAYYERIIKKIIDLSSALTAKERSVRVLVDPLPGIEDSSRFWSINGVLEHLMIVGTKMEQVVLMLASGEVPDEVADIAQVKPSHFEQDQLEHFLEFAPGYFERIDQKLDSLNLNPHSPLRFRHPWFGEITAHQWYWLSSIHPGIHYKQVKAICTELQKISRT